MVELDKELELAEGILVRDPEPVDPRREAPAADTDPAWVVDVASVDGWCRAHHQRGDRFEVGHCSPGGMCYEALVALHPELESLRRRANAGGSPVAELPCPEDGTVTFRVELKRAAR